MNVTAILMGDPPPERSALYRRDPLARITLPTRHGGGGKPRLNPEIVRLIRQSSEPYKILAARYGVSLRAIKDIRRHFTWKHVT